MIFLKPKPRTLSIPLREEPPGVLRVGKSRILLERVIHAHQRGASPREIVAMDDALDLADVFAVIAYYLAHPAEIDEYLHRRDQEADAARRMIEASQPAGPSTEEPLPDQVLSEPPRKAELSSPTIDERFHLSFGSE